MQFPLSLPDADEPITHDWLLEHWSGVFAPACKDRRARAAYWTELEHGLRKKTRRLEEGFWNKARRYGFCYYCHSRVIHIKMTEEEHERRYFFIEGLSREDYARHWERYDEIARQNPRIAIARKQPVFLIACPKCSRRIWESKCVACASDVSGLDMTFLFCIECLERIDEEASKDAYTQLVARATSQGTLVNLRAIYPREPELCVLCGEMADPEIDWMFCSVHHEMGKHFSRYRRHLHMKGLCGRCERPLSEETLSQGATAADGAAVPACPHCRALEEEGQYYWIRCHRCNEDLKERNKSYEEAVGLRPSVGFDVCYWCFEEQAKLGAQLPPHTSSGEHIVLEFAKQMFDGKTVGSRARPIWLEGLELDVYIPALNLAIEYDGEQHFKYVEAWHGSSDGFRGQKERDRRKDALCKSKGVTLVRFRFDEPLTWDAFRTRIESVIKRKEKE